MVRMGGNVGGVVFFCTKACIEGTLTCVENQKGQYCCLQGGHSNKFQKRYQALYDSGRGGG
jgi:hypothetical protein